MIRALNTAKLDFFAAISSMRTIVIMYIVALVIGVSTALPIYTLGLTMVFGMFSAGLVFSVHEKCHSDKLYGILPITRREMILGRYLFALGVGLVNSVIAVALALLVSAFRGAELDKFQLFGVLAIGFLYYCFAISVMYPLYLRFTFAKAYVFTSLPMYLVFVFAMLIALRTEVLSSLGGFILFFQNHLYLAPLFGLILGLALFIASMAIANLIYKKKEI